MLVAHIDGEEKFIEDDLTDVSVQFDDPYERAYRDAEDENAPDPEKYVEEHVNEQAPEAWCNGAGVIVGENDVRVWVSTGDPRGAFALTLYRTKDGEIRLEVPYEGMGFAHEELEQVNDGVLLIKRTKTADDEEPTFDGMPPGSRAERQARKAMGLPETREA